MSDITGDGVLTESLTDALVRIAGGGNVLSGPAMAPYATDVYRTLSEPVAVVRPNCVESLQAVVKELAARDVAFSIRGGGASYTDGYLPRDAGQVLIDLSRLNRIVEINAHGGYVTVEAGISWAALSEALAALDLRTPFRGPFSGLHSTVGGALSQNAISHGSGTYGISAESVLSLDVITVSGDLLRTGSAAADGVAPFLRHFGPDLTGLFTGDCGTLGIKARVTLPVIRRLPAHGAVSFSFPDFAALHEGMRRIALERIEESHFALDAALSQGQIARQERAGASLAMALGIIRTSPSILSGLRQVARAGLLAKREIAASAFMTHYIVEGFNQSDVNAKLHRLRELMIGLAEEIGATVPAVVRAMPFAPFYNTLGPAGERWVPLHGIMPHASAPGFHKALEGFYAARKGEMERLGVWAGGMFSTVGTSGFLYEIALYWPDAITAYHDAAVPTDYLQSLPKYPDNPEARAYVHQLKSDLIDLYVAHGAINFQIGKAYPYAGRLAPPALALVKALKAALDPRGRLAPGNLGLD
ncbi:MAG: FAD-binding oxidoreductase [Sphingobium sp.]